MPGRASIIVVNYNGGRGAVDNLKSLAAHIDGRGWELVVVDNCSTDGSPDAMVRECPSATVVREPANRGYASAVNRGLMETSRDVRVILNADVAPRPGALEELVDSIEENREYTLIGGVLLDGRGRLLGNTARTLPSVADILKEGFFIRPRRSARAVVGRASGSEGGVVPVQVLSGAVMGIHSVSLDELGPMDSEYFLYNEDVEWCRRAHRKGLAVGVATGAVFEHEGGASTRAQEGPAFAARVLSDFHYFCEGEGVAPETIRRLWRARLLFRSWMYRADAIFGILGRRRGSRKRAAIYRLLAGAIRTFTWSPAQRIQNGHPSRLFEFPSALAGEGGDRKRVLQLIPNMEYGGAQRLVETLVGGALAERFRFEILCLTHAGEIGDELRERGIPVHVAGLSGWRRLSEWKRAADYAALIDADLVHSHLIPADIAAYVGFRDRAVRLSTKHNVDPLFTPQVKLFERYILRGVQVLAVSDAVASAKSHLCSSGMLPPVLQSPPSVPIAEVQAPLFREGEPVRLMAIGRLHPQKRIDIFLEAAAELERRSPGKFDFRVVGEGVKLGELRELASRLGIAERVQFCPPVANVADALDDTDVVIMVSDYEGLPLTILETLARARIPLIRRVPGTDGALPHVLEPCYVDSSLPMDVADKVSEICGEPRRFVELALEGQKTLAGRSDYAALTGDIYDGLLAEGEPRARVLHLITRLIVGGAQENTIASVERVDPERFESHLWTGPQTGPEGSLLSEARSRGIVVQVLPNLVREISPLKDVSALFQLSRLMRRERFHVVHTHCTKAGVLGRLAAKLAGIPHITHTHHGWSFHDEMRPLLRSLYEGVERMLQPWTSPMVSVSEETTRIGLDARIGRRSDYRLIRSGIPLQRFHPDARSGRTMRERLGLSSAQVVVGSVGRLTPQKNPLDFVKLAAMVRDGFENVTFIYVGDGPMRAAVEAEARRLGMERTLRILGVRDDVPQLLRAMDVFVLVSLWEGLPRVVPQALASGVPVLAYQTGGIAEAVIEGKNGHLFPRGDLRGMAERLSALVASPSLRREMSRAASEGFDSSFSEDQMITDLECLYDEMLARARPG